MNLNGIEYCYIRNVQGDVTGLFDKNGMQAVRLVLGCNHKRSYIAAVSAETAAFMGAVTGGILFDKTRGYYSFRSNFHDIYF